ncbi:hypothetical protein F9817_16900 [Vibrio sp. CAIM 722]|uniref:histidine kinase n=1 Tax=Vibrio eleionomae TaxID=2653505 RepID=A0A7X4LN60_9VIBR|nr:HAMP domain-containing sensor histidine kinase [Vibrio eleionomae]MZI94856.1 hypothetical protein [Vibrio eleionomae]
MQVDKLSKPYTRSYTLILFILGMMGSVILGWTIYTINVNKYLDSIIQVQQKDITQSLVIFSHEIKSMEDTINLLHDTPSMQSSLKLNSPLNRELAEKTFVSFIKTYEPLMQVRWLDKQGKEQVRVDGKGGDAIVIDEKNLQDKSNRYYFSEGIAADKGDVYLSALDLNIEHGKIEIPYRPTIRVTLRTDADDHLRSGLFILNYDIGALLNSLREFNNEKVQLQIVDKRGYWVMHPNRSYEWGYDLDNKSKNIQIINPTVWQQIQRLNEMKSIEVPSGLVTYKCNDVSRGFYYNKDTQNSKLCFIANTPKSIINDQKMSIAIPSISLSVLLFFCSSWAISRERKMSMQLIQVNHKLADDKILLEQSAESTRKLLTQQQLLQDDLIESGKLSALGMMVAGVAHELNTPLGAAIMASSTIKKEHNALSESFVTGLTKKELQNYIESTKEGLELVESNQQRAAQLIRSFKRLAIDRAREDIVAFNVEQVIDDLIKTLHHRLKVANVDIDLHSESIEMMGIPGIISQVLQNLVVNAIVHAFEPEIGGKVTISATCQNERVILQVADNGKGMHSDIAAKIFEPFVTSKRSQGSTGLGMHFVHQWVTRTLNGSIKVDSELGKGTTFVINIPQTMTLVLPDD